MNNTMWEHMLGAVPGGEDIISPSGMEPEEKIESYQTIFSKNVELTEELARAIARRNTLERENDYLMATLSDIRDGLDALNYHIMTANSSDELPEEWTDFRQAFMAIKITHTALKNAIGEWESKFEDHINEIPF